MATKEKTVEPEDTNTAPAKKELSVEQKFLLNEVKMVNISGITPRRKRHLQAVQQNVSHVKKIGGKNV